MPFPTSPRPLAALTSAALSSAALAVALSGCAGTATTAGAASARPATAQASAVPPAPAATVPLSQAPPSSVASPSAPVAPADSGLATFTFPGGTVSFDYPRDWTVELFHAASSSTPTATATVKDAGGRRMATVFIGGTGDVVSQAGPRTVYESAGVPGLAGLPGEPAHASFYRVGNGAASQYVLGLTAGAVASGENAPGSAPTGLIQTGSGVLAAEAVWDSPAPFASDHAARAWYASDEGRAVRALLLSIRAH